jgi:hypothetical protein
MLPIRIFADTNATISVGTVKASVGKEVTVPIMIILFVFIKEVRQC